MIKITPTDALLIIDPQMDFCKDGALAVPNADEIMGDINSLSLYFWAKGAITILTQDWHVNNHQSFAKAHEGASPFSQIQAAYGEQTLWPDHCVQGTPGAEFHPAIQDAVRVAEIIIRKGTREDVDSYSAFVENDKVTKTGLSGYLRDKGITRVFIVGLARDFCCAFTALDAATEGFESIMVDDLTRAIAMPLESGETTDSIMTQRLYAAGVQIITSKAFNPEKG